MNSDDLIVFRDEETEIVKPAAPEDGVWRVLIVDDDEEVHAVTQLALERAVILDRPMVFLHAFSASEARGVLARETDIAAILLDVVMETDDAGLQLVRHIREDLGLRDVRIILRTGQPGHAPEAEVVRHYDINDYKTKTDLTRSTLLTSLTTAIRGYRELQASAEQRRAAEQRAKAGDLRFRHLAAVASEAIVVTNEARRIEFWSRGAEALLGLRDEQTVGKILTLELPEPYQDEHHRSQVRARGRDDLGDVELTVRPLAAERDGPVVELSIGTWRTDRGLQFSIVMRDVSERCRFEQQLIAARDAASASTRAKAEFLANMSHEIRTPMHGILGMTELTLATALTAEQREYIGLAHASAEGLLVLIDELLDFSKVEASKLTLERVVFDLATVLRDALAPQIHRAQRRGIDLTLQLAPDLPTRWLGDPLRLRQIVLNLVGNALKFTEAGRIVVSVAASAADGADATLLFSVSDTGIGIPADKCDAVFEVFTQADASTSREYGGSGLGLAICAQLVNLMGGRIWVESEVGQGSTFYFTARLAPAPEDAAANGGTAAAPAPPASIGPSLRVLLAEDNPVNQTFAIAVLRGAGHEVTLVNQGAEAVAAVAKAQRAGTTFDLVLMDVQMPVMDGFEATRQIREQGCRTPVIAMTAHAMSGFRELSLAAGMDDFVSKPIRADHLLAKLAATTTGGAAPVPPAAAATASGPRAVIDVDEALATVGGRQDVLAGMAELVLAQIDGDLPSLRALASAADAAGLADAAHRLKGSLAVVMAGPATDICSILESLARQQRSAEFAGTMESLETELRRVRPALEALARAQPNTTEERPT